MQHARLRYAIKFCLDQTSAKALKREAEALFTLHEQLPEHPHIVRLIDLNLTVEPYWLAFDFVVGMKPLSFVNVYPKKPVKPIACPVKRNGNMPVEQGPPRPFILEKPLPVI